jgi:DNA-binding transcriptional MocR family regulator
MTIWQPDIQSRPRPRYLAIAEALAEDIEGGGLEPGQRLPTHRDLAYRLGVTVGTVSRAYAEAERRGLIAGEVGRGTFVRGPKEASPGLASLFHHPSEQDGTELIDLSLNQPAVGDQAGALAAALPALARNESLSELLFYQPEAGRPSHRAAGARWLGQWVANATAERLIVTCGAQHAIAVVLSALTSPGDVVLTESLTWTGVKALASLMHLKLEGVAIDDDGLVPEAFEAACLSRAARVLYCMPTLHNPTASIMPAGRRAEIVDIARRYEVAIIEDDVYSHLPTAAPPALATLAPERTYYLTSASKSLAPGLRVGFLLVPEDTVDRVAAGVRATTIIAPPLPAEVVATWIDDGTARHLIEWQRREATARQAIAATTLGAATTHGHTCCHLWLELPAPWRARDFADRARARGVLVNPADLFMAGRSPAPHAVRLTLGAARDRRQLEKGLAILAEMLEARPEPRLSIV